MSKRKFFFALVLAVFFLAGPPCASAAQPAAKAMGKPDKPDKPDKADKGGNENKPAKVTWAPSRLSMSDINGEGTFVVEVWADKEVEEASLFTSGSLRNYIGLPGEPITIPEGGKVEVTFELIETPEDAGHTIGGTIHLLLGGKHLAKPLTVSLKRDANSAGDGHESDEGDELIDSLGTLPVSWLLDGEPLEDITLDLFDENGEALITMVANRDLRNLGLWFTPSVNSDIFAEFDIDEEVEDVLEFAEDGSILFVKAGTEVTVKLTLRESDSLDEFFGGGTLHVRSVLGNSRSYPGILGVRFNADLEDEEEEPVAPAAVVDAASFEEQPVAAFQIVSIFGLGLGSEEQAVFELTEDGKIGEYLNGTMVLFDGYPAPLLSTSAGQINAIVPSAVRGGDVELQIVRNDKLSALFPLPVGPPTPSLFTLAGNQAAAVNEDGTLNSSASPAARDTMLSLFGTGGGPTQTPLADGAIADQALWLAGQVRVFVGGVEAEVHYAGAAPGIVSAVSQFNIRINPQTPQGFQTVRITIDGVENLGAPGVYVQ
jgi:uncharacterized protein (TIGR03437 family)